MFFAGPFVVGPRHPAPPRARARARGPRGHPRARAGGAGARGGREERTRIARELHDVVAHAISVMVLQARGGRRMLDSDPAETRQALDAIEHAGEQALVEMRRLLGMLRADDEASRARTAAEPRAARRPRRRADRARACPSRSPSRASRSSCRRAIDVSAYRIVQEALTNALKHAGPARAHVIVRYRPGRARARGRSTTAPAAATAAGSGHGLVGMRERVGLYGGELESGRRPGGGYALRARLPLARRDDPRPPRRRPEPRPRGLPDDPAGRARHRGRRRGRRRPRGGRAGGEPRSPTSC